MPSCHRKRRKPDGIWRRSPAKEETARTRKPPADLALARRRAVVPKEDHRIFRTSGPLVRQTVLSCPKDEAANDHRLFVPCRSKSPATRLPPLPLEARLQEQSEQAPWKERT